MDLIEIEKVHNFFNFISYKEEYLGSQHSNICYHQTAIYFSKYNRKHFGCSVLENNSNVNDLLMLVFLFATAL